MADLLDQAHVEAGLALLRADSGLRVYPDDDGNVPDHPVAPYVRVYSAIERSRAAAGNALDGRSTQWTTRWWCHCVGETDAAARAVAMRVDRALRDVRPVIAGAACDLIEQEAAEPPRRDETTGTPVYDLAVVYRLLTSVS